MSNMLDNPQVALVKEAPYYSQTPPYHPSERLPEWPNLPVSSEDNPAHRGVRQLLFYLRLDGEHYNTAAWNPLGEIIEPGNTIVLKPNFVSHRNSGEKAYGLTDTNGLVTHGSVIRAVLDYVAKALRGQGKIIIGDCPIQGTDWGQLVRLVGLDQIQEYFYVTFPGIELTIRDYRLGRAIIKHGMLVERVVDETAIAGYLEIDLGQHSELLPLMRGKYEFGVSKYSNKRMRPAHTPYTNKYLIHRDFIYADVMINLPKIKSHMKAGITCAMKNLVGLVGHKDYIPHFRFGSPKRGGDEYPDGNWLWDLMWFFFHCDWERERGATKKLLILAGRACALLLRLTGYPKRSRALRGGSWYGNDTLWRAILDINRAFFYFDRKSTSVTTELSADVRYLVILDGLIGGHKESPLASTPIQSGVMMAAFNPIAMDAVATAMMGLDIEKIKQITGGFSLQYLPLATFGLENVTICGNTSLQRIRDIYQYQAFTSFEPSMGFKGFVEYTESCGCAPKGSSSAR